MFELECNQVAGSSRVTRGIRSCIAVHVLGPWWGVEHGAGQAVVYRVNSLRMEQKWLVSEAPLDHAQNAPSMDS